MYGCTDIQTYGCIDLVCTYGDMGYGELWMYGCMDVWMYGCMDAWIYVCMHVWMCARMEVWRYAGVDVWMYRRTEYAGMYVLMYGYRGCIEA